MTLFYRGDLISKPISELRKPSTVMNVATYWNLTGKSGDVILDEILDELNFHHEGRLFDYNDMELDIRFLRPKALWDKRALKKMRSLKKFARCETIEAVELFGEDGRRTINAIRRFSEIPPAQALSRALVPRIMLLDFARRIREGRNAKAE